MALKPLEMGYFNVSLRDGEYQEVAGFTFEHLSRMFGLALLPAKPNQMTPSRLIVVDIKTGLVLETKILTDDDEQSLQTVREVAKYMEYVASEIADNVGWEYIKSIDNHIFTENIKDAPKANNTL